MYRIGQEEIDALGRTLMTRDFFKINGSGQEVLRFEEEWKAAVGKEYALLMTSGFAALVTGLIGMGIGPGDERRIREFNVPGCIGIDLNSRFETAPGLKDVHSLKTFIETIRP